MKKEYVQCSKILRHMESHWASESQLFV